MIGELEVKLVKDRVGTLNVVIDTVNFGVFDQINTDNNMYSYFPRKTDKLTGDHYIAIGKALNEINKGVKNE